MKKRLTLSAGMVVLIIGCAWLVDYSRLMKGLAATQAATQPVELILHSPIHWRCFIYSVEESENARQSWLRCPNNHGFYLDVGRDVHVGQWVSVDIAISAAPESGGK